MNIQSLIQQRNAVVARAESILDAADKDDRELTADEQSRYDEAVSEAERINAQIEAESAKPQQPNFNGGGPVYLNPNPPDEPAGFHADRIAAPIGTRAKLNAYAQSRAGQRQAYTAGMFFRATLAQDPAAYQWCQSNGVPADIMAAMGTSPNTNGGALVPDELSRTIIELMEEYGAFRANADNVPMSSDTLTIPRRTGGLTAYYVGENEEGTESDPTWDNISLVAKKLMCLTRMSSEISEDAIVTLGDKMTQEIALAFSEKEDNVGFLGDGTSTYGGHTGALVKALDGSHDKAKVAAASGHDTLGEIDSDDLVKLMAAIPAYAKRGAKWYCSPTALELVFNAIKVGAGGNTLENLSAMSEPVFLGYPIVVSPVFPDDASATYNGSVMIGFGNLAQAATVATRRDIRVQQSEHRYFELDQIGVKGTMRHSINVHDLGSNTVKSPFAVLVGTT